MKPRRVVATIEFESKVPIRQLKEAWHVKFYGRNAQVIEKAFIEQIQVNVIRRKK